MNRAELQRLAEERVLDARALLAAGRWPGAYYLAGYAVECGLKACVLALVERTGVIFQDRKFAEKCWTHDVEQLLSLAGLKPARDADAAADPAFGANWQIVKDWSEASRYQSKPEPEARQLVEAVDDKTNGVLRWIRTYW